MRNSGTNNFRLARHPVLNEYNYLLATITLDMIASATQNSRCDTAQIPSSAGRADANRCRGQNQLNVSRSSHVRSRCQKGFALHRPPRIQMVGVSPNAEDQAPCSSSVFASLVAGKQN